MPLREPARPAAVRALRSSCPRCGAEREAGGRYCLECGLALPASAGALAALRRAWIRRLGWYPGDFVWLALAAAALAAAGAAAAVALGGWRAGTHPGTIVDPAPAAAAAGLPGAGTPWPVGEAGWTVALSSLPASGGRKAADALAARATADGLPAVGVLDSSSFASLQPGYYVVFSGVYGSSSDAGAALPSVQAHGFAGAYSIRIAR